MLVLLGTAVGTAVLVRMVYDRRVEGGAGTVSVVQSWRVSEEGAVEGVAFGEGGGERMAAWTGGAVHLLREGGAVETVRRAARPEKGVLGAGGMAGGFSGFLGRDRLVWVGAEGSVRVSDERGGSSPNLEFRLESAVPMVGAKTAPLLRQGDEFVAAAVACAWDGDTWFVDETGNVLLFQPLDQTAKKSCSVVAFDVARGASGLARAVYLLSTGAMIFFAVDLTCLECRLFSRHAQHFVQQHPFFSALNAKQRHTLVDLAMNTSL